MRNFGGKTSVSPISNDSVLVQGARPQDVMKDDLESDTRRPHLSWIWAS